MSADPADPRNPTPAADVAPRARPILWLRWLARAASLLSLALMTLLMIFEGFDAASLKLREWLLAVFFPLGLVFGLILGWRQEKLGGIIAVASLALFYLVHFILAGALPRGGAFAVLGIPGLLFLLSAWCSKTRNRP